jgi:hypothetical protein
MPRSIRVVSGDDESEIRFGDADSGPRGFAEAMRRHAEAPKANIIGPLTPKIPLNDVRSLSEQLAEALAGRTEVKIEGVPEGFPTKVLVLLEAGAQELKFLGIALDKMTLGQTYEAKTERIYRATCGTREDGQFVAQVAEDCATGKLNLIVGVVYEKGEGRGKHTVSAMLNFENHVPVVIDASTVELSVTCDGVTFRADHSEKKGSLNGYAGGRRESKAGNLFFGYFPDRDYTFPKAFRVVLEMTRKSYGFLDE